MLDSRSLPPEGGSHKIEGVASGFSRKAVADANLWIALRSLRLTASAKATASLAEALRAKAEGGSRKIEGVASGLSRKAVAVANLWIAFTQPSPDRLR